MDLNKKIDDLIYKLNSKKFFEVIGASSKKSSISIGPKFVSKVITFTSFSSLFEQLNSKNNPMESNPYLIISDI